MSMNERGGGGREEESVYVSLIVDIIGTIRQSHVGLAGDWP